MKTLKPIKSLIGFALLFVLTGAHRLPHPIESHVITAAGRPLDSLYEGLASSEWGRKFKDLPKNTVAPERRCSSSVRGWSLDEHVGGRLQNACGTHGTCFGSYLTYKSVALCNGSCDEEGYEYDESVSCYSGMFEYDQPCGDVCCTNFDNCHDFNNPDCQ